jgi:hypothetical protein
VKVEEVTIEPAALGWFEQVTVVESQRDRGCPEAVFGKNLFQILRRGIHMMQARTPATFSRFGVLRSSGWRAIAAGTAMIRSW